LSFSSKEVNRRAAYRPSLYRAGVRLFAARLPAKPRKGASPRRRGRKETSMTTTTFTVANETQLNTAIRAIDVGGANTAISMAGLMD
jgi:ribosomal protein S30